jgi:hypothetical protein
MRSISLFLLLTAVIEWGYAQNNNGREISLPRQTIYIDLANFQDNYPALLLGYENQFHKGFAMHLEAGPVLLPEVYDQAQFDKYLGFKTRGELKLYGDYDQEKRSRIYGAIDLSYQHDQYTGDYDQNQGEFIRREKGKFERVSIGSHFRVGYQRFFAEDKIIISTSLGIGRTIIRVEYPEGYSWSRPGGQITRWPILDPFSANFRLKLGFVLGKGSNTS